MDFLEIYSLKKVECLFLIKFKRRKFSNGKNYMPYKDVEEFKPLSEKDALNLQKIYPKSQTENFSKSKSCLINLITLMIIMYWKQHYVMKKKIVFLFE